MIVNAGLRLWAAQKKQGTGLCVGLDPHVRPLGEKEPEFYTRFISWDGGREALRVFQQLFRAVGSPLFRPVRLPNLTAEFLAGLLAYFLQVVEVAWANGIRVYKPQAAFYERLGPFGLLVLEAICNRLHQLAAAAGEMVFIILDCKRGDIETTQEPYFASYETAYGEDVIPGMGGRFDFDTMTVTTWMGEDVLTPGLPYFRKGKGAIVVTRTSNPSGTTLQDSSVESNPVLALSEKQEPFRFTDGLADTLYEELGGPPISAHEAMLYLTAKFSADNGLDEEGVSPIFSVMGSTVRMTDSFRMLRPGGLALVPGFGAQGGKFSNIEPLLVREGVLAGHWGILASSQAHNFPWLPKYGGQGNPFLLRAELTRAIDDFRKAEKQAYAEACVDYPF
ncbi:MAG: orotidine-5'-phosphate decarboxylase [Candidatus Doudnabacteria bacterium]|nr:orotidine-5'-phosphate decarboxylase [Candidatus Doudnabacteria bacterium]